METAAAIAHKANIGRSLILYTKATAIIVEGPGKWYAKTCNEKL